MASIFDGLNNLPIFEGRSDPDRRRALLETGLALTAPQDPLAGGNALTQLSGGVSAGLASLDKTERKNTATEQQAFENIITGRSAATDETRAEAAQVNAEAAALNSETNKGIAGEAVREFNIRKGLRDAKIDLDKAQAEWLRRRFAGDPSGAGKVTTALIEESVIEAEMANLLASDPALYTLANGKPNMSLLTVQAFSNMHKIKGVAGTENLASILQSGEGAAISENISAIQGVSPPPVAAPIVNETTGGDLPVVSSPEDRDKIAIGQDYIFNGQRYTRQ